MLAAGLVLGYLEGCLPIFSLMPGGKLGLANVATLLAFARFGPGTALFIGLLRCLLGAVFAGNPFAAVYGGAGTLLAVSAMSLCARVFPRSVSLVGRSMLGAFFFNLGQVAICALVLWSGYVFLYLPYLTLIAPVCGLLTGLAARQALTAFKTS